MTQSLPKWVMQRYAVLWKKFKDKTFSYEQATTILKDKDTVTSVFLSDLKKAEWLHIELSPKDSRKRLYKLKTPEQAVKEMVK